MKDMPLSYETKRRKCSKIHKWAFSSDPEKTFDENWKRPHNYVVERPDLQCRGKKVKQKT